MATRRKKRKTKRSPKRITTMRKPRRRTRRKTLNYTLASKGRRRRRTSLSTGPKSTNIVKSLQTTAIAGFGGVSYLAPKVMFKNMTLWQKAIWGILGSTGLHMLKYPVMANGFSGAFVADISKDLFPTFLNDSYDLQEAQFVDADTLSDSGELDENGNPILIGANGSAYALNENNELEELDGPYSLQESTNMQSVSMLPLQDPYSLNERYGI